MFVLYLAIQANQVHLQSLLSIYVYCLILRFVFFKDGDTPLHVACRKRQVNIAELLLGKFNANINIKNKVCKLSGVYHQRNEEFPALLRVPKIG